MLGQIFAQVLAMSLTGSALWLLLRLLRPAAGRCCSAAWQAGTWLAVLCAYLLPVGLLARAGLEAVRSLAPLSSNAAAPAAIPTAANGLGAVLAQAGQAASGPVRTALPRLWLAGVLAACLLAAVRQAQFRRRLRRTRIPVEDGETLELLGSLCGKGLKPYKSDAAPMPAFCKAVKLYTSPAVPMPLGVGLLRPAIYLPEAPMGREELALVLRHELAHIARRDLWVKWGALAATALHWFNPLAWAFSRELGVLCEAACDEAAVRGLDGTGRRFYGETLLNVLGRAASAPGVCSTLASGRSGLKFRLRRILRPVKNRKVQRLYTLLAAAVFCGFLPCAAAVQAVLPAPAGDWTMEACRAWMAESYRIYEPLGLSYDAAEDVFAYRGQPVALLLDERSMGPGERSMYPWADRSFALFFVNREAGDGPCLAAVRDNAGRLTGLRALPPGEAAAYLDPEEVVTFNSFTTQRGVLCARDPQYKELPGEIGAWAAECGAGAVSVRLDEAGGWLCWPESHCPWRIHLNEDGVLDFWLYPLEGSEEGPGVVQFAADLPVTGVRAWLDDKPLNVNLE